jgi:glycosyltransferase involved in cell wall biosynthesis
VVLPSRQENFPNAALEAAACGRPVAAFEVGGNPEVVQDGRTGFLAPPFDTGALADGIARLLGDPATRDRLGGAARELVEARWTVPLLADRYAALYRGILIGRGPDA